MKVAQLHTLNFDWKAWRVLQPKTVIGDRLIHCAVSVVAPTPKKIPDNFFVSEFAFKAVEKVLTVRGLHATIVHLSELNPWGQKTKRALNLCGILVLIGL